MFCPNRGRSEQGGSRDDIGYVGGYEIFLTQSCLKLLQFRTGAIAALNTQTNCYSYGLRD